jgi:hypothetical protein
VNSGVPEGLVVSVPVVTPAVVMLLFNDTNVDGGRALKVFFLVKLHVFTFFSSVL